MKLSRNAFDLLSIIGKGGFGKVWKVRKKSNATFYALKEMSKTRIIDKKCEKNIMIERELLALLKHKFLVNMTYAFQDFENLYLVMDLLTGGDLRYILTKAKRFNEAQTSKYYT